jgi:hypothetical protein
VITAVSALASLMIPEIARPTPVAEAVETGPVPTTTPATEG